MQRIMPDEES